MIISTIFKHTTTQHDNPGAAAQGEHRRIRAEIAAGPTRGSHPQANCGRTHKKQNASTVRRQLRRPRWKGRGRQHRPHVPTLRRYTNDKYCYISSVLILLCMCPHTTCAHACVTGPHTTTCVLKLLHMSPHTTMCHHTTICVLILLYMCRQSSASEGLLWS